MMLSRQRCGICEQKVPEKLASFYWAWFDDKGARHALKQRLCTRCVGVEYRDLIQHYYSPDNDEAGCVACGCIIDAEADPVWLTAYLPKQEPLTFEFQLDAGCALMIRTAARKGATRLEDRQTPRESESSTTAWDSLGLAPQT